VVEIGAMRVAPVVVVLTVRTRAHSRPKEVETITGIVIFPNNFFAGAFEFVRAAPNIKALPATQTEAGVRPGSFETTATLIIVQVRIAFSFCERSATPAVSVAAMHEVVAIVVFVFTACATWIADVLTSVGTGRVRTLVTPVGTLIVTREHRLLVHPRTPHEISLRCSCWAEK